MGSRGREIRMSSPTHLLTAFLLLSATGATWGQADEDFDFNGPVYDFVCPELNGLFADSEQCDLYYVCIDNVATATLCKDGYLFDDSIRNHEKCVLPHNVDCKGREFVQARQAGIDDRCDRFYSCDNGTAHEMPCAFPLIFDVTVGACVRPTLFCPTPQTASSSSPASSARTPTSSGAPRGRCLTPRPSPARLPTRCQTASAGTSAKRTPGAQASAPQTAPVPGTGRQ